MGEGNSPQLYRNSFIAVIIYGFLGNNTWSSSQVVEVVVVEAVVVEVQVVAEVVEAAEAVVEAAV